MNQSEYLKDLFERCLDKSLRPGEVLPAGVSYKSDLTVSWTAMKELKALEDVSLLPPLKVILQSEKKKEIRSHALRAFAKIASIESNPVHGDFLLECLSREKDRNLIGLVLESMSSYKLLFDKQYSILYDFCENKNWQIRSAALPLLRLLPESRKTKAENLCLELISRYSRPHDLDYTASALIYVGTEKSIPKLKEIIDSSTKEVPLNSAITALARIDGKNQVDYFIDLLQTKNGSFVKSLISRFLSESGDIKALPVLIKRVKSILSRKRKTNVFYVGESKPEIVSILELIIKHPGDTEGQRLITWITQKKLDFLDQTELDWAQSNLKQHIT